MAFKLDPGRGNMEATGRGIPAALMTRPPMRQQNPNTGEDLKKQAQAEADKKLKKNIEAKPLGGSEDVRKETGTATNIRLATTPAEIAKWKASIGKPGAGRYNQTVTAEATAKGADKPKTETETPKITETPKTNSVNPKTYFFSNTNQNFGSNSTAGLSNATDKDITSLRKKNESDTNMSNAALGSAFTTGKNNLYSEKVQTADEARLQSRGILPGDYNPASDEIYANKKSYLYGTNRRSSQEQLTNALKREEVVNAAMAKKTEFTKKLKEEQAKKRAEIEAKKKAAQKPATPAQMKKMSPAKMKVSKKTAYDIKEASNQKLKPGARKHYAENAQAAMKNKKHAPKQMKKKSC